MRECAAAAAAAAAGAAAAGAAAAGAAGAACAASGGVMIPAQSALRTAVWDTPTDSRKQVCKTEFMST